MKPKTQRATLLAATMAAVLTMGAWHGMQPEPPVLRVGRAVSCADGTVTVPIRFHPGPDVDVVGLSGDVAFDTSALANPRCDVSGILERGKHEGSGTMKTIVCSEPRPGLVRLGIFGLDMERIPRGKLATLTFDVVAGADPGFYPLTITADSSNAAGEDMDVTGRDGRVRVGQR